MRLTPWKPARSAPTAAEEPSIAPARPGTRTATRTDALTASGLPAFWAHRYACLRDPAAAAAAQDHVRHTVALLPLPYRLGYSVVLRAVPTLVRCAGGHDLRRAPAAADHAAMARLGRLPGVAEVIRASTALALYGALDGAPQRSAGEVATR
ncbi:hypothetical protein [Streptomyces sp. BE303]|uniref:hypothetical protein n=1 Tax=Streptomyces sp. BE303 TaxID=3002528 RepID=UPI002E75BC45|nr:hypothetical protein [Streptomyces sp. BE303]MED7950205.1 hypothetical protein [Streptomyces sp. BE303]